MATAVEHRVTEDGTHQLGVRVDGAFVPFTQLSPERVAALVENAVARGDVAKPKTTRTRKAGDK